MLISKKILPHWLWVPRNLKLPAARAEWRRLAPVLYEMGVIKKSNVKVFKVYCSWIAVCKAGEKLLATMGGDFIPARDGGFMVNPFMQDINHNQQRAWIWLSVLVGPVMARELIKPAIGKKEESGVRVFKSEVSHR